MRLIDADAIIYDEREEDVLSVTEYDIESMPTIEAIPVEWIDQYIADDTNGRQIELLQVSMMLRRWKEEHETD